MDHKDNKDYRFESVERLLQICAENSLSIADVMIMSETKSGQLSREEILYQTSQSLDVMQNSVDKGLRGVTSVSGLTGMDAGKAFEYTRSGRDSASGRQVMSAVSYAVAANEFNASMGLICAAPTAGSCGVLPGVLFSLRDTFDLSRDQMIEFLLTSAAFGLVIANAASIAGAAGGCQAEVGSASAMAAAAAVIACGGTGEQAAHACAMALKGLLGLVCDPVAGLVEIPCVKRNAIGAANALMCCDMALAGIKSRIPCDEVIIAMGEIGSALPLTLRETALGGLAATPTGQRMEREVLGK
jgi:L-serine dehydratase